MPLPAPGPVLRRGISPSPAFLPPPPPPRRPPAFLPLLRREPGERQRGSPCPAGFLLGGRAGGVAPSGSRRVPRQIERKGRGRGDASAPPGPPRGTPEKRAPPSPRRRLRATSRPRNGGVQVSGARLAGEPLQSPCSQTKARSLRPWRF